jgi:hypothetical protein
MATSKASKHGVSRRSVEGSGTTDPCPNVTVATVVAELPESVVPVKSTMSVPAVPLFVNTKFTVFSKQGITQKLVWDKVFPASGPVVIFRAIVSLVKRPVVESLTLMKAVDDTGRVWAGGVAVKVSAWATPQNKPRAATRRSTRLIINLLQKI